MRITGNENTAFILKELGNRIKDARISFQMTREELALKSGVSLSTIVRMENGTNTGTEQVINVLRALNQLHSIDLLIPEYELTPMDIAMGRTKKKRAGSKRNTEKNSWKWGDDKN